jgi:hypothetical protein
MNMAIAAASIPRLVIGILVLVLAIVFFALGQMDSKVAVLLGLCGVGLLFA